MRVSYMAGNNRINKMVPYCSISLRWIDAKDDDRIQGTNNADNVGAMGFGYSIKYNYAVGFIEDRK
jgi:hypothetical protein